MFVEVVTHFLFSFWGVLLFYDYKYMFVALTVYSNKQVE